MTSTIVRDSSIVLVRELRPTIRDPFTVIFSLVQPLILLELFGPLLKGVPGAADSGNVWNWFIPGVLAMIAIFGTSMTGANLQFEIMTGAFERMLATPLSRSSLMVGRALKELTPLVVQALVITLVAIPFGFVLYPLHVAVGLVMLGIFGVGVGALSYALAIAARKTEWIFWAVQQSLLFPLLILSGMMLPLETGPGWMQVASKVNPLTYIVDAERVLFAGTLASTTVLWGFVAAILTAALGLVVGVRSIRKATI